MIILGIETSCDETAICIIETNKTPNGTTLTILGNQLYSQVSKHAEFGGVVPMMAKREHTKNLTPLLEKCLEEAGLAEYRISNIEYSEEKNKRNSTFDIQYSNIKEILARENDLADQLIELANKIEKPEIDLIAVTNGPGLEPALWVGVSFAKALSELWDIPVIPTNHMEGHIVVAKLQQNDKSMPTSYKLQATNYPAIALLISGGHTQLVLIEDDFKYKIIGNTRDDAIGEAFDKVARILGLPYPGGPQISKLAEKDRIENPRSSASDPRKSAFPLPRPMIHSGDLYFSFSGIKTAVLYTVQKIPNLTDQIKQEIAREFEDAVVEVIIKKTKKAVEQYGAKTIIIGGGVSANKKIRNDFATLAKEISVDLLIPEPSASTDNALMIAVAGYLRNRTSNIEYRVSEIKATGNLSL